MFTIKSTRQQDAILSLSTRSSNARLTLTKRSARASGTVANAVDFQVYLDRSLYTLPVR